MAKKSLKDSALDVLERNNTGIEANNGRLDLVISPTNIDGAKKGNSFYPVLHGKATDSIATMAWASIKENKLNNTATIQSGEVTLVIDNFNELIGKLGVSTHKLLRRAESVFTEINNTGSKVRQANYTSVLIPLRDYAELCNYDVMEHETTTAEEASKEASRANNALKNARKKINKDLAILFSSSLSWTEKVRGKQADYMDVRIIEAKGIKNGYIHIRFSQAYADYLSRLPITQYPKALFAIDERNVNAYVIGNKFSNHYNMDNNQIRGTAQLLKVNTLLSLTALPTIEKVRANKRSWEDRIKEPFEKSLDVLTAGGVLENWEYSHSKGVAMTDEEATHWGSYEEWANALIHFTLKDAPDHEERLEARAEEKKKKRTAKKKD